MGRTPPETKLASPGTLAQSCLLWPRCLRLAVDFCAFMVSFANWSNKSSTIAVLFPDVLECWTLLPVLSWLFSVLPSLAVLTGTSAPILPISAAAHNPHLEVLAGHHFSKGVKDSIFGTRLDLKSQLVIPSHGPLSRYLFMCSDATQSSYLEIGAIRAIN